MAYKLTSFTISATGTVITLPTARASHYIGVGRVSTLQFYPLAGGGQFDANSQNEPGYTQGVTIRWRGAFSRKTQTAAQIETAFNALRQAIGVRGKLTRTWDSSSNTQWTFVRVMNFDCTRNPDNLGYHDVSIDFEQISPIWYGASHTDEFNLTAGSDHTNTIRVHNTGNAQVDNAIITVANGATAITGLTIQKKLSATVWNSFTYNGTIAANKTVVINAGAYTVTNDSADDYAHFSFGADHKEPLMFRLWSGNNTVTLLLTGGNTGATVSFNFSDGWF